MTMPNQPGWYDDPQDPNAQRYWDGQDWTPHRQRKQASYLARPPATPVPPHPPSPRPPPPPSDAPTQIAQLPPTLPPAPEQQARPPAPPIGAAPTQIAQLPPSLPPAPAQQAWPPPSSPNSPAPEPQSWSPPPAPMPPAQGQASWPPPPSPQPGPYGGQPTSDGLATAIGAFKQPSPAAWVLIGSMVLATISLFLPWENVTQTVSVLGTPVYSGRAQGGISTGGKFALLVPIIAATALAWPIFARRAVPVGWLIGLSAAVGLMLLSVPLWFLVFRDDDPANGITSSYGIGLYLFAVAVVAMTVGVVLVWIQRPKTAGSPHPPGTPYPPPASPYPPPTNPYPPTSPY
ncbi:MAG: DUF2510 domain-containing protein [Mycobacterium sp.]|uniref:DUF2510 domain-containing protein n=1 Tax=Mycobacterium sp. TaxID=1785 RepID=UPI001EC49AFF|nr:DUF2510 domain-containing protein [Mycobacterium sp.]MBW0016868.1 DUF2510 domain-containing protein [Mycobacterium sp.]